MKAENDYFKYLAKIFSLGAPDKSRQFEASYSQSNHHVIPMNSTFLAFCCWDLGECLAMTHVKQ